MKEIILTEDQAKTLTESKEPVEIRDAAGSFVVRVDPLDAAALAGHRRRKQQKSGGETIPGSRVRAHLDALQAEWERTGGFDEVHLRSFLDKIRAEEGK
jgi:hypothetical protein